MFSTTPTIFWWVCTAMEPARSATSAAACCGVVTTRISAFGTSCATEIAMSPVPGGRSSSRTSRSPQYTSARNCWSARCSIGPRQTTGRVARGEHADGDDLHAVRGRRHDHVLDLGGPAVRAEHARHAVAVDVGVDDADLQPVGRHRRRQVHRHRGLADAALAGGDRVHPGQRAGLGEGHLALGLAAAQRGRQLRRCSSLITSRVDVDAR